MREVLHQAHINMFMRGSILGKILSSLGKLSPSIKKRIENFIAPLFIFEYGHSKLSDLSADFLNYPPYKRTNLTRMALGLMRMVGLVKDTPHLGLFLVHTRRAQLPARLTDNKQFLVSISNPIRWHISRFNYFNKRKPDNIHASDICYKIGEFKTFKEYCGRQMAEMQDIYYLSYSSYLASSKIRGIEELQYPTDIMKWFSKADKNINPPRHYGLLSFFLMWFFLPEPYKIMSLRPGDYDEYIYSSELKKDLKNFNFIHTQDLNQESYNFLKANGYKDIEFTKNLPPANVSTHDFSDKEYLKYYTDKESLERIYKLEKALFVLFPQYEETYQRIALI